VFSCSISLAVAVYGSVGGVYSVAFGGSERAQPVLTRSSLRRLHGRCQEHCRYHVAVFEHPRIVVKHLVFAPVVCPHFKSVCLMMSLNCST